MTMPSICQMIVLFTDFGAEGPYVGQMKSVLLQHAPHVPIVDLLSNAPVNDPKASAYLLAAYVNNFPAGSVFLCVVDPGVGGVRDPVVVNVDGQWFVGPGNGLFNMVASRGEDVKWWDITWRPARLSSTFHGRDLFAPIAARLALAELDFDGLHESSPKTNVDWPDDYASIIYIDHFGNAITGIRATSISSDNQLKIENHSLNYAEHYSAVAKGDVFWYENANGLVEIAVNQGRAEQELGIKLGDSVSF